MAKHTVTIEEKLYAAFEYGICKLIDAYCLLGAYELPLFTVLISLCEVMLERYWLAKLGNCVDKALPHNSKITLVQQ